MSPEGEPDRTFVRRPNMFVASSSEALPVARAVKTHFEGDVDVDIWVEGTFEVNQGTLDSLLNLSAFYDFAVAVFTKDDKARIREHDVQVTRDNVIFEFGLFLGRLGPHRAFFIAEEGVNVFTDWAGITTAKFTPRSNLQAAVGTACDQVRRQMDKVDRMTTFTLLPSTSLAIGYYTNFLSRVLEAVRMIDYFQVVERDDRGNQIPGTEREISTRNREYVIHVELPRRLRDLESAALRFQTRGYTQIELSSGIRKYPFYIRSTADIEDTGDLDLFDIPTTLLAARRAIDGIFDESFLADGDRRDLIERREIANFETTLRTLVHRAAEERYFVFKVWDSE